MHKILPLLTALWLSACASVFLGTGAGTGNGVRGSPEAPDARCGERLWRALGSPPTIRLACEDGTVVIRGTVSSDESRRALVDVLRRQPGVERVVDRLRIR